MSKARILKLPEMGDHRKQQSHCYSQSNKEVRRPLQKTRPMILNALRNPKRQRPSYPSFRGATTVNDYIFVIVMSLPSAFPPRNLLRTKEITHRKKSHDESHWTRHVEWGERPIGHSLPLLLIRSPRRHDHDSIRNREFWVTPFGRGRSPIETTVHALAGHPGGREERENIFVEVL